MADAFERWLRQQVALGGREVILTNRELRVTGREAPGGQGQPAAAAAAPPGERPPARGGEAPRWLKDLPPVPGDGVAYEPPGWGLVDEVAGLASLEAVAQAVAGCRKCPLCEGRTRTVPGEGDPAARLMLVGEGPGQTEDETGRPFVGAAGALLDSILSAIEIPRERVFIANVVKCRPPKNRTPLPEEQEACLPYLRRQIELVRPKVLVALGATAAAALLGTRRSLGELRGKVHRWGGIPLIATYHPAALLRNPNWKRPTWDDVRIARQLLDR